MKTFQGFDPNGFMLLELNKFNDSRDFYESVKEDIKKMVIVPMRNLASDLSEELYKIDRNMNLIPTKMVSRIRRDTRRSKNKEMYRSNVWCMFMRDKNQFQNMPCMWFEFFPDGYSYGVGIFRADASFMQLFRDRIRQDQKAFKAAVKKAKKTGAVPEIISYKKDKSGIEEIDKDIKMYYNSKAFYFTCFNSDMSKLVDGTVYEELLSAIKAFAPLYKMLSSICDEMIKNGE